MISVPNHFSYVVVVIVVVCGTGMFVTVFGIAYVISPRFCHRLVGYLEEEAVKTYTHCLEVTSPTHTSQ